MHQPTATLINGTKKTNQLLISIFSQYHLKDSPGEEITGREEEQK